VSDDEELIEVLLRQRSCAADWLVIHARDLAALAERRTSSNLLIFACVEARNAIEQLWFEILVVLRSGEITLKFVERIRRRRDGFLAAIREAEPNYRKLARFSMLCMRLDSQRPVDIIPWDLRRLKKWWHALSEHCHAQAEPMTTLSNPIWFTEGLGLVREVFGYFREQMSQGATGIMRVGAMIPVVKDIWEDFVADKIDVERVLIRLQIVRPPPRK
jgi:hypothetical protein